MYFVGDWMVEIERKYWWNVPQIIIDSVSNRISADDSNIVGLVFESEGVVVVNEVSLPPIIQLSGSSSDNEGSLSREGAYIQWYILYIIHSIVWGTTEICSTYITMF